MPLGVSHAEFASYIGLSKVSLSYIVTGKRNITPEIALKLADALGTTAEYWMELQAGWDLWKARLKHKPLELHPKLREPQDS